MLTGFLLLLIPWFHKVDISVIDNLFTAASAVSTTGLVTISIFDSYNWAGQLIILALFQVGGIGYLSLTTYFLLLTTHKLGKWHHKIIDAEFTLPRTIRIPDFIRSVILFTIVMEVLGAVVLSIAFMQDGMPGLQAAWFGLFHSVSAYCTAGFSLFNSSFMDYSDNILINATISVLAIAGSMGFIVITDFWYRATGKTQKLSFTTKIILWGFAVLLSFGTLITYLSSTSGADTLLTSFFQTMSAMTTVGFNSVDTGLISLPILLLVVFLMYIGASPSGTAGGMKITTLTALIAVLASRITGKKRISLFGKRIPFERLYVATSSFFLYTSLIFLFTFILSFFESFSFEDILFEVASSLGTVGMSRGITGDLSSLGKAFIILLMYIGRVGVLTFGFALLARKKDDLDDDYASEDDIAV
jgi:trk system potassium uptake protein TrkH